MELPTSTTTAGTPASSRSRLGNLRMFRRPSPTYAPGVTPIDEEPAMSESSPGGLRRFWNKYSTEDNGGLPRRLFLPSRHSSRRRSSSSDSGSRPSSRRSSTSSRHSDRWHGQPTASGAISSSETSESGERDRTTQSLDGNSKRLPLNEAVKHPYVRRKLVNCLISGLAFSLVLAIFLAFTLTSSVIAQEFHIMLIMFVFVLAIFLLHSVVRLLIVLIRGPPDHSDRPPSRVGPMGYATPSRPIRVVLARDEELAQDTANAGNKVAPPPPAYGLWRSSVRINPNLLYWQRVEEPPVPKLPDNNNDTAENRPDTAHRPPSYMSDTGVDYVINAQPRSIAPREPSNVAPGNMAPGNMAPNMPPSMPPSSRPPPPPRR